MDGDIGELFDSIVGYEYKNGVLHFKVRWKTDEISTVKYSDCRADFPYETAKYIISNKIGSATGTHATGPHQRWARTFLKRTNRILRRFIRWKGFTRPMTDRQDFKFPKENEAFSTQLTKFVPKSARRVICRRTKPGRLRRLLEVKFGLKIPRNVREVLELDRENGNKLWEEAMKKEIASLIAMNCFKFHPSNFKPGPNSQFAPLQMIFEVVWYVVDISSILAGFQLDQLL